MCFVVCSTRRFYDQASVLEYATTSSSYLNDILLRLCQSSPGQTSPRQTFPWAKRQEDVFKATLHKKLMNTEINNSISWCMYVACYVCIVYSICSAVAYVGAPFQSTHSVLACHRSAYWVNYYELIVDLITFDYISAFLLRISSSLNHRYYTNIYMA